MNPDMVAGLTITAVGLIIVFTVLVVLSYCFSAMKLVAGRAEGKAAGPVGVHDSEESPSIPVADVADQIELVVAISAALAAFLDEAHVVTSIRRVEDTAAWSRTGRHDQMVSWRG